MTDEIFELTSSIERLIEALEQHREHYENLWQLVRTELDRRSGQTSLNDYC